MSTPDMIRGHPVYKDPEGVWRFSDTSERTDEAWEDRPCGVCDKHQTPEGHDPCLGTLPGVRNACCGHGVRESAYIQFENGAVIRGFDVIENDDMTEWCGEEDGKGA